jgi:hypothetical protein
MDKRTNLREWSVMVEYTVLADNEEEAEDILRDSLPGTYNEDFLTVDEIVEPDMTGLTWEGK